MPARAELHSEAMRIGCEIKAVLQVSYFCSLPPLCCMDVITT